MSESKWLKNEKMSELMMRHPEKTRIEATYAVEVWRMKNIGPGIIDEITEKLKRFPRRENATLRKALVYEGSPSPVVKKRGWFDALIPARKQRGGYQLRFARQHHSFVTKCLVFSP